MRKKGKGNSPTGLTPEQYKAVMELRAKIGNPIARAQSKQQFFSQLTNLKLSLYMIEKGERNSPVMGRAAHLLALIGMAAERQWEHTPVPPDVDAEFRILRGGLSASTQGVMKWDLGYAISIERSLDAAVSICKRLDAKNLLLAEHDIEMLELNHRTRVD